MKKNKKKICPICNAGEEFSFVGLDGRSCMACLATYADASGREILFLNEVPTGGLFGAIFGETKTVRVLGKKKYPALWE